MRCAVSILAGLFLFGCTRGDETGTTPANSTGPSNIEHLAATYRSLNKITKEPVYVDPGLALRCAGASEAELEAASKTFGPHAHTAITIYMNDLAAGVFGKANPTYPVGSVVVKEKKAIMTQGNDGVGGMIKRSPGYDPAHGDWEYFYFEDPGKIESGRMVSCVQCHSGAAGTDYVFGSWARGDSGQ